MEVRVRLFGSLGQRFPSYQRSAGLEVQVPEGATVQDLLTLLGLTGLQGTVVIAAGRVLKAEEPLQPGVPVDIMQAIGGG